MDIPTVLTWLAVVAGCALFLFVALGILIGRFIWRVHRDAIESRKEFNRQFGRVGAGEFVICPSPTRRHVEAIDRFLRRSNAA